MKLLSVSVMMTIDRSKLTWCWSSPSISFSVVSSFTWTFVTRFNCPFSVELICFCSRSALGKAFNSAIASSSCDIWCTFKRKGWHEIDKKFHSLRLSGSCCSRNFGGKLISTEYIESGAIIIRKRRCRTWRYCCDDQAKVVNLLHVYDKKVSGLRNRTKEKYHGEAVVAIKFSIFFRRTVVQCGY